MQTKKPLPTQGKRLFRDINVCEVIIMQERPKKQARYTRDDLILENLRGLRQELRDVRKEMEDLRREMHAMIRHSQILTGSCVAIALGVLYFVATR